MPRTSERLQSTSVSPDPASPNAVLALKRAELSPRALTYAESIEKQIQDIFSSHNISSIEEFESVAKQKGEFSSEEIEKLQKLLGILRETAATGEIPTSATIIRAESPNKDIVNPFSEVYAENGAPNRENLEEFEIDLGEILEICKETYRKKELDTWVKELPANIGDIVSGDPKQQERFRAYLKEGRIPVFMPPASVQLETMKEMLYTDDENRTRFKHFKPDVIWNGAALPVEDGIVGSNHFKQLMENKNPSLVTGVPDTCYIMWIKPTIKPEYTLKNLAEQKKYIQDEQAKFIREHNVTQSLIYGIMPAEYAALQIVFPDIVRAQAQKDKVKIQSHIIPCKGIYTRFPGIVEEEYSNLVAIACWDPGPTVSIGDASRLELGRHSRDALGDVGVRLVVRE